MRWVQCLVMIAVLLCAGACLANERKPLLKVGIGDWCPYVCKPSENDGKIGYAAEILKEVFEDAGYEIEFASINYSRGIEQVRSGKKNIMACMYKDDAPDLVFPKVPLGMSVNHFFAPVNISWHFVGKESLHGRRVGLVQDYIYPEFQDYIENNPQGFYFAKGVSPMPQLLTMLKKNRLDAVFDDKNVVLHQARKLGVARYITDAGTFGVRNKVLVGFAPNLPGTPKLVQVLEDGIVRLREAGKLALILKRYGVQDWVN